MKRQIVVCDNDLELLNAFSMIMGDDETVVTMVSNADALAGILDRVKADILFMDIHMPNRDGDQILHQLRASDKHRTLPVIMISGSSDGRCISLECGADGFLAKPFDIIEIENYIRRFVYER